MTETEKIQDRISKGYTMSIYGTRENIHEQMVDDIDSLLILNEALIIDIVSVSKGKLPYDLCKEIAECPACENTGKLCFTHQF